MVSLKQKIDVVLNPNNAIEVAMSNLDSLYQLISLGKDHTCQAPLKNLEGKEVKINGRPIWSSYDGKEKPGIIYVIESLQKATAVLKDFPDLQRTMRGILDSLGELGFYLGESHNEYVVTREKEDTSFQGSKYGTY